MHGKTGIIISIVIIAVLIPCLVMPVYQYFYYGANTYDADIGLEWVWRARATNDLKDMANYLQKSLQQLDRYHGNPVWLYPKPDYNYDLIKGNIQEVIKNCEEWSKQPSDSMAYQQAVHNLQTTLEEIADHLTHANGENNYSPKVNPTFYILAILDIIIWIAWFIALFME